MFRTTSAALPQIVRSVQIDFDVCQATSRLSGGNRMSLPVNYPVRGRSGAGRIGHLGWQNRSAVCWLGEGKKCI